MPHGTVYFVLILQQGYCNIFVHLGHNTASSFGSCCMAASWLILSERACSRHTYTAAVMHESYWWLKAWILHTYSATKKGPTAPGSTITWYKIAQCNGGAWTTTAQSRKKNRPVPSPNICEMPWCHNANKIENGRNRSARDRGKGGWEGHGQPLWEHVTDRQLRTI